MSFIPEDELVLQCMRLNPTRLYVAATGASPGLQSRLWCESGASKYLVGCSFPYDAKATEEFLGYVPIKAVHWKTAVGLAQESFMRACRGSGDGMPVGLGLTAAVTTDRERRGMDSVQIAVVTPKSTWLREEVLGKMAPDIEPLIYRSAQSKSCDDFAMEVLERALLSISSFNTFELSDEQAKEVLYDHPIFNGHRREKMTIPYGIMFPGSFNPIHDGHREIMHFASEGFVDNGMYVLTSDSVHKPLLSSAEILRRAAQFRDEPFPLLVTRDDALFIQKARQVLTSSTFAIGADTLVRMLEPQWFEKVGLQNEFTADEAGIVKMLEEFEWRGITFKVFDRKINGKLLTLEDIEVPWKFKKLLFYRVPRHWDISSTEIREKGKKQDGVS